MPLQHLQLLHCRTRQRRSSQCSLLPQQLIDLSQGSGSLRLQIIPWSMLMVLHTHEQNHDVQERPPQALGLPNRLANNGQSFEGHALKLFGDVNLR